VPARAAGIDIEVVKEMLGHTSSTLTRDTYTTVGEEAKHQAAATPADLSTLGGTPRPATAD
jgi:integrase